MANGAIPIFVPDEEVELPLPALAEVVEPAGSADERCSFEDAFPPEVPREVEEDPAEAAAAAMAAPTDDTDTEVGIEEERSGWAGAGYISAT